MGGQIQVLDANGEIIDFTDCSFQGLEQIKGFLLRAAVAYLSSSDSKDPDVQRAISTLNTCIREPGTELDVGMTVMASLTGLQSAGLHGMNIMKDLFQDFNFDPTVKARILPHALLLRKFNLVGLVWYLSKETFNKTQSDEIASMFDTLMPFLEFTPKEQWPPVHREEPYTEADFEKEEAEMGIKEKRESVRARNKRKKAWIARMERERKKELKKPQFKEEIRGLFTMCPSDGEVTIG